MEKGIKRFDGNMAMSVMVAYFKKMKGEGKPDTKLQTSEFLISAFGGLLAISIMSVIAVHLGYPMSLGPIGASSLLVFSAYNSHFSQPRQVIGGHLISTILAISIWDIFGRSHITIGMTLALVLITMAITKTMHPPAAASAIVAINTQSGWGFLLTIMICILLLVCLSTFYNNLFQTRHYPKYWF